MVHFEESVQIFDSDGRYKTRIGSAVSGNLEFASLTLATSYVADESNDS